MNSSYQMHFQVSFCSNDNNGIFLTPLTNNLPLEKYKDKKVNVSPAEMKCDSFF